MPLPRGSNVLPIGIAKSPSRYVTNRFIVDNPPKSLRLVAAVLTGESSRRLLLGEVEVGNGSSAVTDFAAELARDGMLMPDERVDVYALDVDLETLLFHGRPLEVVL